MTKLHNVVEHKKHTRKHRHKEGRFYTRLDMSIIKHDAAVNASLIKRGESLLNGNNHYVVECGCGTVGCFIHGNFKSRETSTYVHIKGMI